MKIYCSTTPEYDKRLDQFLGTDIWILMKFPDTNSMDAYMNLVARDGDMITYKIISAFRLDSIKTLSESENYVLKFFTIPRTQLYARLKFIPVEPFNLLTTGEIQDMMNDAGLFEGDEE